MRTYTLRPGLVPEFEKRFAEAIPHREKYSPMAAFWHTEIGPVNQVIHLWPYADLHERARIRAETMKDPNWPPKTQGMAMVQESKILVPAPFSPPLEPRAVGPYIEIRTYDVEPGKIPTVQAAFVESIPDRVKLSPLVGAFSTEFGALNQWIHIWAYKSLDERARIRDEAMKAPTWPPKCGECYVRMETKICLPAPYSKIR
jgi:hypothetical protein